MVRDVCDSFYHKSDDERKALAPAWSVMVRASLQVDLMMRVCCYNTVGAGNGPARSA